MQTTIQRFRRAGCLLCASIFFVSVGVAAPAPTAKYASTDANASHPQRVDIALVLAVDVSSSIDASERRFQREAYADALSDPRVAQMALGGRAGRIAIAYMEWSGRRYQRVHLPIRVMSTPEQMAEFAQDILHIQDGQNDPMFVQPTAVGNALLAAETAMSELPFPAGDYVIDISGDGVRNDGFAVLSARDHLLSMGLTVNGLPIEVSANPPRYDEGSPDRVSNFYEDCVIGGPGSFHLVARGFGDVRETLIMKLMLEMAQLHPSEKRRLASAWNANELGEIARIIPATVLQLAPSAQAERPRVNCGDPVDASQNPFKTSP
ncbi:MAG: DUF1194 domain-containing protein [Roseobacter sp.]